MGSRAREELPEEVRTVIVSTSPFSQIWIFRHLALDRSMSCFMGKNRRVNQPLQGTPGKRPAFIGGAGCPAFLT